MKILFIGGTGNISTDCAALLHQPGHEISVVTRGRSPVPATYRAVVADRQDMRTALAGSRFDVVINFLGFDLPDVTADAQLFGGAIRQYIFISSATVYAKPHRQIPITESAPLGNAFSPYAQKKLACEEWLRCQTKLPVTIVRPSHTYSPQWMPNCVSSGGWTFAARLLAGKTVFVPDDGANPWTLTATSDFAVGLAGLVGNANAIGETFHITSDEALTWNQIYAATAAALGVRLPSVERIPTEWLCERFPQLMAGLKGDKSNPGVFDNAKIKRFVPEFVCRKPFAAGIRESVAWFRSHPAEQTVNGKTDALFEEVVAAWRTRHTAC
jgi:nucleoside-diphosphate-sugar epimerase